MYVLINFIIYDRNIFGEQATISWWHGKGGLLDYTNTEAVDWWHHQMDNVREQLKINHIAQCSI